MKHLLFLTLLLSYTFLQADFQPGDTVASPSDRYTIEEQLGEGFFGKVFKVHGTDGTVYAMKWYKEMPEEFLHDNPFFKILGDVKREHELGQLFDHPHILKSVELFSDDSEENHFLILEFISGSTLFHAPRNSLSAQKGIEASRQLVQTLKEVEQ